MVVSSWLMTLCLEWPHSSTGRFCPAENPDGTYEMEMTVQLRQRIKDLHMDIEPNRLNFNPNVEPIGQGMSVYTP